MKQVYDRFYLFRIWSLCLFIAPLIFFATGFIQSNNTEFDFEGTLSFILIFMVFSLALSMPGLIFSQLIYYFINSKRVSKSFLKVIICLVSTSMIFLTFYLVDGKDMFSLQNFLIPFSYCIGLLISVLVCKLRENSDY